MKEKVYNFAVNCSTGLENLVEGEIVALGGKTTEKGTGFIKWTGGLQSGYRACLWSRYCSKVLLQLHTFTVKDEEDLYRTALTTEWLDHLSSDMTFSVSSTLSKNATINHSHYAALKVKDGIVDSFRQKGLERPNVKKERADLRVHVHVSKSEGTLYIDFSGDSLHRRGYRGATGAAPLKETLAAAIVSFSGWSSENNSESVFLDPMCGSGTLLIEAALLWSDSAPGLSRKYFGFLEWLGHDEKLWSVLVDEAVRRENEAFERDWPRFVGYDCDPEMVEVARRNISNAGLAGKISINCQEIAHLQPPAKNGYIVSNLPFGERLSQKDEVGYLYRGIGNILQRRFGGWKVGLLITETDLADKLRIENHQSVRLYNGPLVCRLFTGNVREQPSLQLYNRPDHFEEADEGGDLYNRLMKNFKKARRWAEKNNISCMRIYDSDLPEYNVAIDIYERWVLVQEYAAPPSVDEGVSKKRFSTALAVVRSFFNIGRQDVFIKQRKRQKGKTQYQKKGGQQRFHEVYEEDCCFLVNFTNYLDTGLFLDHRPIRKRIGERAAGKMFLNLFGYTGTATVHAAKGGALSTTTVDLSSNYLEWAKRNLLINGLKMENHNFVCQDCITWLKETRENYDLIFIDPPTFSNTKKKNLLFDVQRNHVELIKLSSQILNPGGVILFSTNFKKFKLDKSIETSFKVVDISRETIPMDFQRKGKIHKSYEISLVSVNGK